MLFIRFSLKHILLLWCIAALFMPGQAGARQPDPPADKESATVVLQDSGDRYSVERQNRRPVSIIPKTIMKTKTNIALFKQHLVSAWSDFGQVPEKTSQALMQLSKNKGLAFAANRFLLFLTLIAIGFGAEFIFYRLLENFRQRHTHGVPTCISSLITQILGRLAKGISGLLVFSATILFIFILIVPTPGLLHEFVILFFPGILLIRAVHILLTLIYSPREPQMRIAPQDCLSSMLYFRGILAFVIITVILKRFLFLLKANGLYTQTFLIYFSAIGILQFLILMAILYMDRARITRVIIKKRLGETVHDAKTDTGKIQSLWLLAGITLLVCFEILWQFNLFVHKNDLTLPLLLTLLSIPFASGLYSIGSRLLQIAAGHAELMDPRVINKDILKPGMDILKKLNIELPEKSMEANRAPEKSVLAPYLPALEKTMAVLIGFLLLFWIFDIWGIRVPLGLKIVKSASTIFITLLFSYIFWELSRAFIDMKIQREQPAAEDTGEGDGEESAGGSRKATILTLVRKMILTGLVLVAILTVLSALGVDIGPLLAGAGILGIAIGFGSQTLVKDILSGLFFLIDDAFRVGDYIETTGIKGTVQQISLRSIKIRHPRGMLFTVPYGDMGSIQNFSRDYIITKLDLRVRYDTDINKIRKLIKRINTEINEDQSVASVLLSKIKSQGVRAMDDSAMILRVKFKTVPGGQFIIRRMVFQRIQEIFKENGIEFAHKNVTVYLPDDSRNNPELLKAGAAAAAAAESQGAAPVPAKEK